MAVVGDLVHELDEGVVELVVGGGEVGSGTPTGPCGAAASAAATPATK